MNFIAHRGNIVGPSDGANHPDCVAAVLSLGFDVEIDLWVDGSRYMLGHDEPQHEVDDMFLLEKADQLLVHCKNFMALDACGCLAGVHYVWHETDRFTMTSEGYLFVKPGEPLVCGSIAVMPELATYSDAELKRCIAVVTDYPMEYRQSLEHAD